MPPPRTADKVKRAPTVRRFFVGLVLVSSFFYAGVLGGPWLMRHIGDRFQSAVTPVGDAAGPCVSIIPPNGEVDLSIAESLVGDKTIPRDLAEDFYAGNISCLDSIDEGASKLDGLSFELFDIDRARRGVLLLSVEDTKTGLWTSHIELSYPELPVEVLSDQDGVILAKVGTELGLETRDYAQEMSVWDFLHASLQDTDDES